MPPIPPARPAAQRQGDAQYTFTTLRALPHLPDPKRSLDYLERLRNDAGIMAVMKKYKWTVGVLAEMEPIGNTNLNGKTLGKNWNKGAMIEVRLRTDDYGGYRHYNTVRKTMAHELAHMVHSDHDAKFWELCRKLEGEIERGDWRSGGRALTNEVFYEPPPQPEEKKETWKGGVQRLRGASPVTIQQDAAAREKTPAELRREMMAKAAEERMKKLQGK
ncbi:WLM domain-containing protein [Pyronema domesticum]|uniref:Similar to Ubiquitin and WLM domain-containing protein C1442.07c acc. no. O94580 n=1 Tax=Pyronema omphalodes (strain CBS 100304) TaxID=1076935 RepID=U4KY46_PYROM|nr:WLM domain-containing protein [Pyronema domesticum]CCX06470.1 Similar to Ubiquitin and WLM domain-containing protein C1442.07c; acc. no. O94580 [Pyronema omphalodes CBS 100304]